MKKSLVLMLVVIVTFSMIALGSGCKAQGEETAVVEEKAGTVEEESAAAEKEPAAKAEGDVVAQEEIRIVLSSQFEPQPNVFSWMFGMEEAGKKMGCTVEHYGPTSNTVADQVDQLNSIIASKPDGIAIIMTDASAFQDSIATMNELGIPWGTFNTGFMGMGENQLFYVGADHYESGRRIAEYALEVNPDIKHSLTLNQQPGHSALDARTQGELDVMKEHGLTGEEIDISLGLDEALARTKAYLIEHPETGVIFTNGGAFNAMAYQALEELDLENDVVCAFHDADSWTCQAIMEGKVAASAEQQFFLQGYLPVVYLYNYVVWGMKPPETAITGPNIITKDNVDKLIEYNKAVAVVYGSS